MNIQRKKIIAWVLFLVVFAGVEVVYLWKQRQVNRAIIKKIAIATGVNVLWLGNSHAHFGGYIDQKKQQAVNLAFPSELFVFTHLKIKLLQPKTVLVALNPQHLQKNNEDALRNGLLSEVQYSYLYEYLDARAQELLYKTCPFEQWAFFKTKQWLPFLGSRFKTPAMADLLGSYKPYHNDKEVKSQDIKRRLQTVFKQYNYQQSTLQLTYLKEIIKYCKQQGIRLVFVGFPLHPNFFAQISPKVFREFRTILQSLKPLGDFEYWDYTQQFTNPALFYDPDHLNTLGAKVLNKLIFERLEE